MAHRASMLRFTLRQAECNTAAWSLLRDTQHSGSPAVAFRACAVQSSAPGCFAHDSPPCRSWHSRAATPQHAAHASTAHSLRIDSCRYLQSSASGLARSSRQARPAPVAAVASAERPIDAPAAAALNTEDSEAAQQGQSGIRDGSDDARAPSDAPRKRVSVFDYVPMLEEYMRLRASGKHVSAEEEMLVMEGLLERQQQLEASPGECS